MKRKWAVINCTSSISKFTRLSHKYDGHCPSDSSAGAATQAEAEVGSVLANPPSPPRAPGGHHTATHTEGPLPGASAGGAALSTVTVAFKFKKSCLGFSQVTNGRRRGRRRDPWRGGGSSPNPSIAIINCSWRNSQGTVSSRDGVQQAYLCLGTTGMIHDP